MRTMFAVAATIWPELQVLLWFQGVPCAVPIAVMVLHVYLFAMM